VELKQFGARVIYVSPGVVVSPVEITKGVHIGHLRITNVPFGDVWNANHIQNVEPAKSPCLDQLKPTLAQLVLSALFAKTQKAISFVVFVMIQ
jgi:hypothetical protein